MLFKASLNVAQFVTLYFKWWMLDTVCQFLTQRDYAIYPFQGSNPISDVWSKQALRMCNEFMIDSINDEGNFEARKQMCAASAFAGESVMDEHWSVGLKISIYYVLSCTISAYY